MKYSSELKYGLIFALVVVVYVMFEHLLGFNTSNHEVGQYTRFGGVLVPIVAIFLGLRAKRKKLGHLTIRLGVKTGFIIALVQTTLTTIWFLVYPNFINPEFYPTLFAFEEQKMIAQGLSLIEINDQMATLRTMFSLPVQPIFQMTVGIAYGVILAAIFSAFLRRKKLLVPTE